MRLAHQLKVGDTVVSRQIMAGDPPPTTRTVASITRLTKDVGIRVMFTNATIALYPMDREV